MTRVAHGDLLLSYTLQESQDNEPDQGFATKLITLLYKQGYTLIYGVGNYSADESTDTNEIIQSEDFKHILIRRASHIIEAMYQAGRPSEGDPIPMPKYEFNKADKIEIKKLYRMGYVSAIRIMGSEYDDIIPGG